jgi:hypothetical protein
MIRNFFWLAIERTSRQFGGVECMCCHSHASNMSRAYAPTFSARCTMCPLRVARLASGQPVRFVGMQIRSCLLAEGERGVCHHHYKLRRMNREYACHAVPRRAFIHAL